MIDIKPLNLPEIIGTYIASNIPSYLFERLRADPSVRGFARANSTENLLHLLHRLDMRTVRTPKVVALAYAAFVAVTFKEYGEARRLFSYEAKNLAWYEKLLQIFDRDRSADTTVSLIVQPTLGRPTTVQSTSNTSRLVVNLWSNDG